MPYFFFKPKLEKPRYRLPDAAKLLAVSEDFLLEEASKGKLCLLVPVPEGASVYSVHVHAVDIVDPLTVLRRIQLRLELPDEIESSPIDMDDVGIEGLYLSNLDCRSILENSMKSIYLFDSGYKDYFGFSLVTPRKGRYSPNPKKLMPGGWCLALYPRSTPPKFLGGFAGYSQPYSFLLKREDVFIARDDLDTFMDVFDVDLYISELMPNGRFVVNDRPAYISRKLALVIDFAEEVLSKVLPENRNKDFYDCNLKFQIDDAIAGNDELMSLMDKGELKDGVVSKVVLPKGIKSLIMDVTLPSYARRKNENVGAFTNYITPEIKILLVAAKYFWGSPASDGAITNNPPLINDVETFMRAHGFKGDSARSATTLIRPEEQAYRKT